MQKCDPLNDTHQPEATEVKPTSSTVLPAFSTPRIQYKGRKKSILFRLTCEDKTAHTTDKIWQQSNFEDEARKQQADLGNTLPLGLALYFLPKMKPNVLMLSKKYNEVEFPYHFLFLCCLYGSRTEYQKIFIMFNNVKLYEIYVLPLPIKLFHAQLLQRVGKISLQVILQLPISLLKSSLVVN